MSTNTISPLRQRMIEDMNARKLGAHSQRSHISSCKRFAAFLKRSPDAATAEDIRWFQLHLSETGMSICNRNRIMTGVKFLLRVTLRRLDLAAADEGDNNPEADIRRAGQQKPGYSAASVAGTRVLGVPSSAKNFSMRGVTPFLRISSSQMGWMRLS